MDNSANKTCQDKLITHVCLQKYTVKWKQPGSASSDDVVGHRIYYKEYAMEELIGYEDVPIDKHEVIIVGQYYSTRQALSAAIFSCHD